MKNKSGELPDDILENERFIKSHMKMTSIMIKQEVDKIDDLYEKLERQKDEEIDGARIERTTSIYVHNLLSMFGLVSGLGLDNLLLMAVDLKGKISEYRKNEGAIEKSESEDC